MSTVIDTVLKTQGNIEVGYLHLGAGLGNGKEGSDVRDTVDQKQKVLYRHSDDGVRLRPDYSIRVRLSRPR